MDMVTGMDMNMKIAMRNRTYSILLRSAFTGILLLISIRGSAEIHKQLTPYLSSRLTYTSNVDQNKNNTSSNILDISAGLIARYETSKASFLAQYELSQTIYSDDATRNDVYQQLDALLDYQLSIDGAGFYIDGSIDNIAPFSDQNAISDIFTGNTIEQSKILSGFRYSNDRSGFAYMDSDIYYQRVNNQDNIANHNLYGIEINANEGRKVKYLFWDSHYSYEQKLSSTKKSAEYSYAEQLIGFGTDYAIAPFIKAKYENINYIDNVEQFYYGGGIRLRPSKRYYIDISYNRNHENGNESHFGGALSANINRRLSVYASYDKRFFGDAYQVSLNHQSKRLTNTILYQEIPSVYDREISIFNDNGDEIRLDKKLIWEMFYRQRRTSYRGYIEYRRIESIASILEQKQQIDRKAILGAEINHQLERNLSAILKVELRENMFDKTILESNQNDRYQLYSLQVNHKYHYQVSSQYGLEYRNRNSNIVNYSFDEFRLSANLKMEF